MRQHILCTVSFWTQLQILNTWVPITVKHVPHCYSHFLVNNNHVRKLRGAFLNDMLSMEKSKQTNSSLAGAKFVGIKCWHSFLDWKRVTFTVAENLVLDLPRSKGSEQADFTLSETFIQNSNSGHAVFCISGPVLHLLCLYLHRQPYQPWNYPCPCKMSLHCSGIKSNSLALASQECCSPGTLYRYAIWIQKVARDLILGRNVSWIWFSHTKASLFI